ncbi:putative CoA enzyme activase [Methanocella paludicola SANAE]|uniref:CoA enzyme activase n=1 Tax=Methanocella paludicola (strain DSM 17711 / JCM 13418 / NBRC 101707 / SANAE) TaxID=304371 RepID=D1YXG3_METPS|nr:methanogenesis marker 15 protein [Methanocella paludicola]BAI61135.1 putative CoA enzyme activase [Methanocella paludicola SANAE]
MRKIRIAHLTCGSEYSGVEHEIEEAAEQVNAQIVYPEVDITNIKESADKFGLQVASPDLRLMIARAQSIVKGDTKADAVFITSCFRCAEGAITRNAVRNYIQSKAHLPVISYSFTERTTHETLLTRMEALSTTALRRSLLAREEQVGLTAGIDSGSSTTKAVIMRDNNIIGTGWVKTTDVLKSADDAYTKALEMAGVKREEIGGLGTTGYGRFLIGKHNSADLIQEELTVNSKGAVYLAKKQKGPATVIDIGGMDNKAIAVMDGIPGSFTMGGICAGASGRFLEQSANRLGVDISDLGELAIKGNHYNVNMNSYCIVFGTQSLVNSLSMGKLREDVAAAACYSVAEQVFEQQLQEIEVKKPVIMVGGSSLNIGLVKAMSDLLKVDVVVPPYSQYIGAVGAALLVSGLREEIKK